MGYLNFPIEILIFGFESQKLSPAGHLGASLTPKEIMILSLSIFIPWTFGFLQILLLSNHDPTYVKSKHTNKRWEYFLILSNYDPTYAKSKHTNKRWEYVSVSSRVSYFPKDIRKFTLLTGFSYPQNHHYKRFPPNIAGELEYVCIK